MMTKAAAAAAAVADLENFVLEMKELESHLCQT